MSLKTWLFSPHRSKLLWCEWECLNHCWLDRVTQSLLLEIFEAKSCLVFNTVLWSHGKGRLLLFEIFLFSNQCLNGLKHIEIQSYLVVRRSDILISIENIFLILRPCVNTAVALPDKIKTKHGNEWTNEWNFREYFRVQSSQ